MLIITDKSTIGIRGEGGLSGSRKSKEDRHIAVLAFVGRRMKRQHIMLDRHFIKEHGEDALFHLSSILCAQDDHLLLRKVNGDRRGRGHPFGISIGWERASIVDDIVRVEMLKLLSRWTDKHISHEEGVVGTSAHNADFDPVSLIPSRKSIDNIDAIPGI